MEQIVKVSPKMKTLLSKLSGIEQKDIKVIVFEPSGITIYAKEYGVSKVIKYNEL